MKKRQKKKQVNRFFGGIALSIIIVLSFIFIFELTLFNSQSGLLDSQPELMSASSLPELMMPSDTEETYYWLRDNGDYSLLSYKDNNFYFTSPSDTTFIMTSDEVDKAFKAGRFGTGNSAETFKSTSFTLSAFTTIFSGQLNTAQNYFVSGGIIYETNQGIPDAQTKTGAELQNQLTDGTYQFSAAQPADSPPPADSTTPSPPSTSLRLLLYIDGMSPSISLTFQNGLFFMEDPDGGAPKVLNNEQLNAYLSNGRIWYNIEGEGAAIMSITELNHYGVLTTLDPDKNYYVIDGLVYNEGDTIDGVLVSEKEGAEKKTGSELAGTYGLNLGNTPARPDTVPEGATYNEESDTWTKDGKTWDNAGQEIAQQPQGPAEFHQYNDAKYKIQDGKAYLLVNGEWIEVNVNIDTILASPTISDPLGATPAQTNYDLNNQEWQQGATWRASGTGFVYTATNIPGVWRAGDGNFYNSDGYQVNSNGDKYILSNGQLTTNVNLAVKSDSYNDFQNFNAPSTNIKLIYHVYTYNDEDIFVKDGELPPEGAVSKNEQIYADDSNFDPNNIYNPNEDDLVLDVDDDPPEPITTSLTLANGETIKITITDGKVSIEGIDGIRPTDKITYNPETGIATVTRNDKHIMTVTITGTGLDKVATVTYFEQDSENIKKVIVYSKNERTVYTYEGDSINKKAETFTYDALTETFYKSSETEYDEGGENPITTNMNFDGLWTSRFVNGILYTFNPDGSIITDGITYTFNSDGSITYYGGDYTFNPDGSITHGSFKYFKKDDGKWYFQDRGEEVELNDIELSETLDEVKNLQQANKGREWNRILTGHSQLSFFGQTLNDAYRYSLAGQGISEVIGIFSHNWGRKMAAWRSVVDELFSSWFTIDGATHKLCDKWTDRSVSSVALGRRGFPAAHIEGIRNINKYIDEDDLSNTILEYVYRITFSIDPIELFNLQLAEGDRKTSVKVVVLDNNNNEVMLDINGNGEADDMFELRQGSGIVGTTQPLIRISDREFHKVCIIFQNPENLDGIFKSFLDDSKLCNRFDVEDTSFDVMPFDGNGLYPWMAETDGSLPPPPDQSVTDLDFIYFSDSGIGS